VEFSRPWWVACQAPRYGMSVCLAVKHSSVRGAMSLCFPRPLRYNGGAAAKSRGFESHFLALAWPLFGGGTASWGRWPNELLGIGPGGSFLWGWGGGASVAGEPVAEKEISGGSGQEQIAPGCPETGCLRAGWSGGRGVATVGKLSGASPR